MQKNVIDTNVIVSSLIQRNYPYKIIYELFTHNKFMLCVSEELMSEYYEVLSRPKFAKFPDFFGKAENLLADIETKATKFVPSLKFDLISDKDDNMILELAEACKADFIITGNTNDFTFSEFKETKIVSPE
ncbi:putative toxin-antitoxin system toxin component, PIN family [Lunatibacter salilacus]|uniref:putative toxin-antitoxin system toxin component, PIN family n=1 Tax=Lunatibacter salilacus TaxID=2483804 RepID=UPI00131D3806|nr:putative toxin-antitoxin system toxin component, PIN family [Lunatibacter salilacus]